jgi:Tfp pilus assembly protein PilV
MKYSDKNQGQSLVEAMVAVTVVTLVLTGLIYTMTFSLANTQIARNRTLITKYAQEANEFIRNYRDSGWNNLSSLVPTGATKYCINDLASWILGTCGTGQIIGTNISREVVLTPNAIPPTQITVDLTLTSTEGSRTVSSQFTTVLTNWYVQKPLASP